jgi:uncharacterized NAD(P)/FAD-binding protein YdhS
MPTPIGPLLELVRKLDALGPELAPVDVARALESARLTAADVAPFVQANPHCYNRRAVVIRDHYELVVVTWLPGQSSVPHDHTGSLCAMQIVQGEAIEGCYRVADDGYVDLEYETTMRAGDVSVGQDAGIHTLRNPAPNGEWLVTIHAYAPRLREYRRFVPRPVALFSDAESSPIEEAVPTVVVVGGGFSGSVTAAQILSRAGRTSTPVRVVLVERRGAIGDGVAYSTRDSAHLLNVPAGRMSAWPDRPNDFVEWAARRYGNASPADFLPRQWYGEYLRELVQSAAREAVDAAQTAVVFDEVRRVDRHPVGGWMVHLARGNSLRAEAVVLAIGHRPPSDPVGRHWTGPRTRFIADPSRPFAASVVGPEEPVVILGSGLTAVDTVLSLAQPARRAPITLVSRHGFLPHAHAVVPVAPADLEPLVAELIATPGGLMARKLLRALRQMAGAVVAAGGDWRSVVDGLRPHTATLWQELPSVERRRFLAQLRPFWEVHRHRMPAPVADRFRELLDRGAVRVIAGRVESVHAAGNDVQLFLRERAHGRRVKERAGWVINCTGPMPSNCAESNPVVASLLVSGLLRQDELALGVETTSDGNAIDAEGRTVHDLFVVGTLRKPGLWESTAVPELRNQAAAAAEGVLMRVLHALFCRTSSVRESGSDCRCDTSRDMLTERMSTVAP